MAPLLHAKAKVAKRGQIDGHEREKRSEVQDFDRSLPPQRQGSHVSNDANDQYVVSRASALGVEVSEDCPGQEVVASHTVEQSNRAQMSRQPASQARHQQYNAESRKQTITSDHLRDIHKRSLRIGERTIIWPYSLRQIDLKPSEKPGEDAHEHRRKQHIPPRVMNLFRQYADPVKTDVSGGGQRCACRDGTNTESSWIIQRLHGHKAQPMLMDNDVVEG